MLSKNRYSIRELHVSKKFVFLRLGSDVVVALLRFSGNIKVQYLLQIMCDGTICQIFFKCAAFFVKCLAFS